MILFAQLKRFLYPHATANVNPIVWQWYIVIEHGTVLETCAIDALMDVIARDRDMWIYATYDMEVWNDFCRHRIARKKAIAKEFMDRYA